MGITTRCPGASTGMSSTCVRRTSLEKLTLIRLSIKQHNHNKNQMKEFAARYDVSEKVCFAVARIFLCKCVRMSHRIGWSFMFCTTNRVQCAPMYATACTPYRNTKDMAKPPPISGLRITFGSDRSSGMHTLLPCNIP